MSLLHKSISVGTLYKTMSVLTVSKTEANVRKQISWTVVYNIR